MTEKEELEFLRTFVRRNFVYVSPEDRSCGWGQYSDSAVSFIGVFPEGAQEVDDKFDLNFDAKILYVLNAKT